MLELKVTVGRPTHHCQRKVKCNGSEYTLALPLETYRFVQIAQEIEFRGEQQGLIATLSGKREVLPSFEEFYRLQEDALKYFNLRVELNCDDLALKLLSETDKILVELDRCRFPDLLALLRRAYDTYAKKLHSKFNRRIKKYLAISTRSESEKEQIKRLLELIKAESTDEEVFPEKEQKKQSPAKGPKNSRPESKKEEPEPKKENQGKREPARKAKGEAKGEKKEDNRQPEKEQSPEEKPTKKEQKPVKKEQKPVKKQQKPTRKEQKPGKKEQKHSHFYEELRKDKNIKKDKVEHEKEEDNEEDWEDVHDDEEEERPKPTKKTHQTHKRREDVDEQDWEDIHEEKFHKRQEKNNRRKHEKFDLDTKKENQPFEKDEPTNNSNTEPFRKEREPRRNNNGNGNSNGNGNGNGNRNFYERSKEKQKKDLRVLLGLNGDSDDGWRERHRVERVPVQVQAERAERAEKAEKKEQARKADQAERTEQTEKAERNKKKWVVKEGQQPLEKKEGSEKEESKSPFQKQPKQDKQKQGSDKQIAERREEATPEPQKVVILPSQGSLEKIFSFPADGKQYVLDPSKEYRIRVNNSFWIMLEKSFLKIEKDKAGYIRDSKFRSSQESLIEAQDITINLNGMCNLEDGGTPFGGPKIENFTGTDSQWFHLKELEVYTYK